MTHQPTTASTRVGVCGILAAVAAAGRVLRLDPVQMLNAFGLGFNRPIQTFQSIVDGTTAVRVGQGLISQGAITCVQMAQNGRRRGSAYRLRDSQRKKRRLMSAAPMVIPTTMIVSVQFQP